MPKHRSSSQKAKRFYADLKRSLLSSGPKEAVNILSALFMVEPPKVIVSSRELQKYCPPCFQKKYFKNCGYFHAPNTLVFDRFSAKNIFIVAHEFFHYIDFMIIRAAGEKDRAPLQKQSEDITRKKCENLIRLLNS